MKKIFDLTRGVHVILEMLANVSLDLDLDILAQGGRVVVIGSAAGSRSTRERP